MIVITGAAGFIGSYLASFLNNKGIKNLILVDDFSIPEKKKNYTTKTYVDLVCRTNFLEWLKENKQDIDFIFHLGARTDTSEFNFSLLKKLNLDYSKNIFNLCCSFNIPLVYASSAATYGLGNLGFEDNYTVIKSLKPLNPYGKSKNEFDKWVIQQEKKPPFWAGLKFFNVYGPNEYHKKRMSSVIFHAFNQIKETKKMKLFASHHKDYKDGEQLRDFIYVKDIAEICFFMMERQPKSSIYNAGTGVARTFKDLAINTFKAMGLPRAIEFIPTPIDIRENYQYYTKASIAKIRLAGYNKPFYTLEEGVEDYVSNFLSPRLIY